MSILNYYNITDVQPSLGRNLDTSFDCPLSASQAVVAGIQQAHAEQLANMRIQDLNVSLKPLNSVNNPILRKRKLLGYSCCFVFFLCVCVCVSKVFFYLKVLVFKKKKKICSEICFSVHVAAQSPVTVSSFTTQKTEGKTPTQHWKNYEMSLHSVYYHKLVSKPTPVYNQHFNEEV